jgi:(2R)-sulfolactate sulfo-lyase subunit alpha
MAHPRTQTAGRTVFHMNKPATIESKNAAPAATQSRVPDVLAHDAKDNVAVVVVEGLKAGSEAFGVVTANNSSFTIAVKHDIPIGHKIALADFSEGDTAIKYGQDIGRFVQKVGRGEHVHVHNLKTKRW